LAPRVLDATGKRKETKGPIIPPSTPRVGAGREEKGERRLRRGRLIPSAKKDSKTVVWLPAVLGKKVDESDRLPSA